MNNHTHTHNHKPWPPDKIVDYLPKMEEVVQLAGKKLVDRRIKEGPLKLYDTGVHRGHEESTLDETARANLQEVFFQKFPHAKGLMWFESEPFFIRPADEGTDAKVIGRSIIDELEGTTNAKRAFSSPLYNLPKSGVSLAMSNSEYLGGVGLAAFYNIATDTVFSAQRLGTDAYQAFINQRLIEPRLVTPIWGDSVPRGVVIGYSNSFRHRKADVEAAIWKRKMKTYDGCRASSVDLCDLLYGAWDFYVDLRHFWSRKDAKGEEQEAMLQGYDIAAMMVVCLAAGLKVFTVGPKIWQDHKYNETLPLVVCRPSAEQRLREALDEIMEKWKKEDAAAMKAPEEHPLESKPAATSPEVAAVTAETAAGSKTTPPSA